MSDRMIIGVVLPEGYAGASDFARDCNVEVVGQCTEGVFFRNAGSAEMLAALHAAVNWFTPPNDSGPFPLKQIADAIAKAEPRP